LLDHYVDWQRSDLELVQSLEHKCVSKRIDPKRERRDLPSGLDHERGRIGFLIVWPRDSVR
jgi:hypothetical protein